MQTQSETCKQQIECLSALVPRFGKEKPFPGKMIPLWSQTKMKWIERVAQHLSLK